MCGLLTGVSGGRPIAGTHSTEEGNSMEAVRLLVTLEARAGKNAGGLGRGFQGQTRKRDDCRAREPGQNG